MKFSIRFSRLYNLTSQFSLLYLLNTQHLRPQLHDTGIRKFASERQRILLFQDQFTTETYMNSLGAGKRGNFLN